MFEVALIRETPSLRRASPLKWQSEIAIVFRGLRSLAGLAACLRALLLSGSWQAARRRPRPTVPFRDSLQRLWRAAEGTLQWPLETLLGFLLRPFFRFRHGAPMTTI